MAKKVTAHFRGKSRVRLGSNAAAHLRNVQARETTAKIWVVARVLAALDQGCRPLGIYITMTARPHAIR